MGLYSRREGGEREGEGGVTRHTRVPRSLRSWPSHRSAGRKRERSTPCRSNTPNYATRLPHMARVVVMATTHSQSCRGYHNTIPFLSISPLLRKLHVPAHSECNIISPWYIHMYKPTLSSSPFQSMHPGNGTNSHAKQRIGGTCRIFFTALNSLSPQNTGMALRTMLYPADTLPTEHRHGPEDNAIPCRLKQTA